MDNEAIAGAGSFSADNPPHSPDHFYQKLAKLNESSGLSFVFNFRETMLDLHRLYREVIKRGGFYQVTKMGKWADVASAMNLKSSLNSSTPQLRTVYETLILEYELLYCRNVPEETNPWPEKSSLGFSKAGYATGEQKDCDISSFCTDGIEDKPKHVFDDSGSDSELSESSEEEVVEMPDAPVKPRTGYQIFIKLQMQRLKNFFGENSGSHNLREMADQAWRSLSEKGKEPYMEASKMDKERYEKEMMAYEILIKSKSAFATSTVVDDVYHVSLEPDYGDTVLPDESVVELATAAMKNAQSENPMFQIDWEDGFFDSPFQTKDESATF